MKKKISKVLVTGANGAVGSDLIPVLQSMDYRVLATDIDCPADNPFKILYMDIRRLHDVKTIVYKFKPDCIVHLAAEVDLEYCELNPDHAFETNAEGTRNIAKVCKEKNILMVYVSSVGIFDGRKKGVYTEEDPPRPLNVYGKSKFLGEKYVRKLLKRYFIVRASWMIGGKEKDKKFVAKILRLIRKGVKLIEVVTDKKGTPTYTADLSRIIGELITTKAYGIYNVASDQSATRYEIGKKILEYSGIKSVNLKPVKSNSASIKKVFFAPRPGNESLNSEKINKLLPGIIKPWQERLEEYLRGWTGVNLEEEKTKFSIAICFYSDIPRFYKDLKKFKKLKHKNFELIIVTDKLITLPSLSFPTKVVLTGKDETGVGEKRDYVLKVAKGDYIAYIDDDAYPHPEWLSKALFDFKNPEVGAVGGPNLTPPEDPFWAKIGGYIYESYLTSGGAQHRFLPKQKMVVSELQGVNLIIRKELLQKIGGFSTKLFSGDDTRVCYSIRILGYEVLYDPKVVVYHHRREFPLAHLRQIMAYGVHRGFFVKKYPETSMHPIYFLPSLLTIGFFAFLVGSFFSKIILFLFFLSLILFLIVGVSSTVRKTGFLDSVIIAFGIILTHLTYGIYFLKSLFFVKNLEH